MRICSLVLKLSYVKCSFDHDLIAVVFPWTVRIVNVCSDYHTSHHRLAISVPVVWKSKAFNE